MNVGALVLRCYAERDRDGTWFAMCLDLNLYARGDTFDEARTKLDGILHGYIRDALTIDKQYIADLVRRPAPVYFWMRYWLARCLHRIHRARCNKEFSLPLPVVPA